MTMPKNVSMGSYKKDKDSAAAAKGKNNKSFSNELFASVDNLFYEFGIIGKPKNLNSSGDSDEKKDQ